MPLYCQKLPQKCHKTAIKLPFLMPNCFLTRLRNCDIESAFDAANYFLDTGSGRAYHGVGAEGAPPGLRKGPSPPERENLETFFSA
jgi:hypothetical protein